jgi:hypothetical protein
MSERLSRSWCSSSVASLALAFLSVGACKGESASGDKPQGSPPPPVASAPAAASGSSSGAGAAVKPAGCDPSQVGIADEKLAGILPAQVGSFCVLKTGLLQSWGDGTPKKIENITDLIDGGGDLYVRNYLAKRYDRLSYLDPSSPGTEVQIDVSAYENAAQAYGLYSYRLVNNVDPDAEVAKKQGRRAFTPVRGGGAAALGNASALLWKGSYVVELTYVPDATKTLAQASAAADAALPKFVEAIGDKLVGSTDPPIDVRALPTVAEGRIELGVEYVPPKWTRPEGKNDAFKVAAAGGYAVGYLKLGDKRARAIAMVREDLGGAKDAYVSYAKLPGATAVKELGEEATQFSFPLDGGAKGEGIAARQGMLTLAIIDEELAAGDPAQKDKWPRLSKDEKIAKLKSLFAARPNGMPVAGAAAAPSASAAPSAAAAPSASK